MEGVISKRFPTVKGQVLGAKIEQSGKVNIMRYRAEIDGLRAVAVIPVILYHAGFELFSGGFVGVDVFFVISGYLIASIILREREAGTFSLIDFYERRARRILPALFFVMAACIPFAWLWMMPGDLKEFAQSLIAVPAFSSNMLFLNQSGYFATANDLKPLLHTWSLAVEEQFYILFPLFLIITWRMGKHRIVAMLIAAALLSLGAAQWGSLTYPDITYYLLPARGWEIILGVLVAFYLYRNRNIKGRNLLSLLGLAMLVYSIFAFDEHMPFPSVYTLVPTVGAALIIIFATPSTLAGLVLSRPSIVGIGLISYSAYLWHQPLLSFARHASSDVPSQFFLGVVCVSSLMIAYISWRFIERPFRDRNIVTRKVIFSSAISTSVVFISIGIAGHFSDGFKEQWIAHSGNNAEVYNLIQAARSEINIQDDAECRFNVSIFDNEVKDRISMCYSKHGSGIAVLGDSHAADLFGVVTTSNDNDNFPFIVGVTKGGCRPHTPKKSCQYDGFLEFVEQKPTFETIIYEQAGFYLLRGNGHSVGSRKMISSLPMKYPIPELDVNDQFVDAVSSYLARLSEHATVVWFGPRVEPHISQEYILTAGCNGVFNLREGQEEEFFELDAYIANAVKTTPIIYLSQNDLFKFDFKHDFMNCRELYWHDGDHFSAAGEKFFGNRANVLTNAINLSANNRASVN
jgi:peptidoglycan/LPS O-acetylase OafA/YrhL